jgi:hypothetical protein
VRSSCDAESNRIPDGGDSGSKKCKRGYGGAYGEVWRSLRLAGAWSRAGQFCVGAFGRNLTSVAVKMFSHLICFIKDFFIRAVLSDLNYYVTVKHEKVHSAS